MPRSKAVWPLAPTLFRINANVVGLTLTRFHPMAQISNVLSRSRSHQSVFAPPTTRE